jgi:hypothetical protein
VEHPFPGALSGGADPTAIRDFHPRAPRPRCCFPDALSCVAPFDLGWVHALTKYALAAGLASGKDLGVLCLPINRVEYRVNRDGIHNPSDHFALLLGSSPFINGDVPVSGSLSLQGMFYMQGLDAMSTFRLVGRPQRLRFKDAW